jgi:hypothetical protein
VLFENLELIRTVRAGGGTLRYLRSPLVRRLPPDARTFLSQRVRQAYDSLAQPWRLAAEPGEPRCSRPTVHCGRRCGWPSEACAAGWPWRPGCCVEASLTAADGFG